MITSIVPSDIKDPLAGGTIATTDDIKIRRATPADVGAIHTLVRRAYEHYVTPLGYVPGPMRKDYSKQLVKNPVWLAEIDGTLAGLLELIVNADHVMVENLAIDPEFQNRKIGRWFMDFAERVARLNDILLMRTYTHPRMDRNVAIYLHLGYAETYRDTIGDIPRLHLEKKLSSTPTSS